MCCDGLSTGAERFVWCAEGLSDTSNPQFPTKESVVKRTTFVLFSIILSAPLGCDPGAEDLAGGEPAEAPTEVTRRELGLGDVPGWKPTFDHSFWLQTGMWDCEDRGVTMWTRECKVPDGYVAIGGGAWAEYPSGGVGALLTGSTPRPDMLAWVGSSKAHAQQQPHNLHVYVIGIRIAGTTFVDNAQSRQILLDHMKLAEETSGVMSQPAWQVNMPSPYTLIGGGARINYVWGSYGNLLVESFPEGTQWKGAGKDHGVYSPASITVRAIGINPTIWVPYGYPTVKYYPIKIRTMIKPGQNNPIHEGPMDAAASPDYGWSLASIGGKATWGTMGRMLFRMRPSPSGDVTISSKDHIYKDRGYTSASLIQLQTY
jgi:hypothetical protein